MTTIEPGPTTGGTTSSPTTGGQEPKERAAEVAETARSEAMDTAATAADQAGTVVSTAKASGQDVAATVKSQVSEVAGDVVEQTRNLVGESRQMLRDQAQSQTEAIAGKLRELGDQLTALLDGRPDEAGAVGEYARDAAERVRRYAGQLEQRGLDGVLSDVRRVAGKRPGTFLVGALAAGFGIGRVLRNSGGATAGTSDATGSTGDASAVASSPVLGGLQPGVVAAVPAEPLLDGPVVDVRDTSAPVLPPTDPTLAVPIATQTPPTTPARGPGGIR